MNKEELKKYAESQGFKLNPKENIVNGILDGLSANEKKYNHRYCPCRVITGKEEIDKTIICPCIYHKEEIKKQGRCHCGLFVK